MATRTRAPILTPHSRLLLAPVDEAPALVPALSHRLQKAFARGPGHGLLQLGAGQVGTALPPVLGYWREFGARYVTTLCTLPDIGDRSATAQVPPPPNEDLDRIEVVTAQPAQDMAGVVDHYGIDLDEIDARTDPMYDRASIPVYGELARLSAKVLRPGGTLAVMCGMSFLPEILGLMTPHPTFRTVVAFLTPAAGHCRLRARAL